MNATNKNQTPLIVAVEHYFDSCPPDMEFPLGGTVAIPTAAESELINSIKVSTPVSPTDVLQIRNRLNLTFAYSFVIFAVRMAVQAVRVKQPSLLIDGLLGLVIDSGEVDWRDVLCALSMIEKCAVLLGVDLRDAIEVVLPLASTKRRSTVIDGYFARPVQSRDIGVMGFRISGTADSFGFSSRD